MHRNVRDPEAADRAARPSGKCRETSKDKGAYSKAVEQFFLTDFQAPLLGTLLYADVPFLLLPRWLSTTNRADALDWSFESGWDSMWERLKKTGLRFDDSGPKETGKRSYFKDQALLSNTTPATIINATLSNNGMPIILAPFYFSNFYGTLDDAEDWSYFRFGHFFDVAPGMNVPLTTAVLLGARFPYVTPGGRFPTKLSTRINLYRSNDVALADGGYFDNTGTSTALALARQIKSVLERTKYESIKDKVSVELVRMVDPSHPALGTLRASPNEAVLPLTTLYLTRLFKRDFYGRLIKDAKIESYDLTFDAAEVRAPLSWQLSRSTRKRIDDKILDQIKMTGSDLSNLLAVLDE